MSARSVQLEFKLERPGSGFFLRMLFAWAGILTAAMLYCVLHGAVVGDFEFRPGVMLRWTVVHWGAWPLLLPLSFWLIRFVQRRVNLVVGVLAAVPLTILGSALFAYLADLGLGGEKLRRAVRRRQGISDALQHDGTRRYPARGAFAIECAIDELAEHVGTDPLALRLSLLTRDLSVETFPQERSTVSAARLRRVLEAAADKAAYDDRRQPNRAVGIACHCYSVTVTPTLTPTWHMPWTSASGIGACQSTGSLLRWTAGLR